MAPYPGSHRHPKLVAIRTFPLIGLPGAKLREGCLPHIPADLGGQCGAERNTATLRP